MDAELDTGNILGSGARSRSANEHSWDELTPKLATAVGELLPRPCSSGSQRRLRAIRRTRAQASYFRLLRARVRPDRLVESAAEIERQVRAWRFHCGDAGDRGALAEIDGETRPRAAREPRAPPRARDGVRRRHTLDRGDGGSLRPVVGITSYAQDARWGVWDLPAVLVPLAYVDAIERAGGRAVVIPPAEEDIEQTLDALDGIVFSGGADVDPARYGAEAHPETDIPQTRRDAGELGIAAGRARARHADARDLPRLPAAERRARRDLVQHLPGEGRPTTSTSRFRASSPCIRWRSKEGSRLASIVGASSDVTSHHHQGLGRVGDGLVETAWAADGTLEAVEDPSLRFAVGVQWHPEAGEDAALFQALVEQAREYRVGPGVGRLRA